MKKRKKILCIAIAAIIVIAVVGYIFLKPYLRIAGRMSKLLSEDYEYTLDYKLDGTDLGIGDILLNGDISGEKSGDVVKGDISVSDNKLLEVYGNKSGDVVFNVKPLLKLAVNDDDSSVGKILKYMLGDTYISFDQIKEITGYEDVDKIKKVESFSLLYNKNKFKKVDRPDGADASYLDDADFFQIKYKGRTFVVGIPKDENHMYLETNIDDVKLIVNAEYEYKDVDKIEMPEANVSDKTVSILKGVFEKVKAVVE